MLTAVGPRATTPFCYDLHLRSDRLSNFRTLEREIHRFPKSYPVSECKRCVFLDYFGFSRCMGIHGLIGKYRCIPHFTTDGSIPTGPYHAGCDGWAFMWYQVLIRDPVDTKKPWWMYCIDSFWGAFFWRGIIGSMECSHLVSLVTWFNHVWQHHVVGKKTPCGWGWFSLFTPPVLFVILWPWEKCVSPDFPVAGRRCLKLTRGVLFWFEAVQTKSHLRGWGVETIFQRFFSGSFGSFWNVFLMFCVCLSLFFTRLICGSGASILWKGDPGRVVAPQWLGVFLAMKSQQILATQPLGYHFPMQQNGFQNPDFPSPRHGMFLSTMTKSLFSRDSLEVRDAKTCLLADCSSRILLHVRHMRS